MASSQNAGVRTLAKDTVIYGVTNIGSKFLNWLLAPFYIRVLASSAEYGVVTNLYAWVSVLLVVLTLGLETGLFRFISSAATTPRQVYATCLKILAIAVGLFWAVGFTCLPWLSQWVGYPQHPEYVGIFLAILGMDAFMSVPFAYLRYSHQALKFSGYKFLFIGLNIFFNLFFLLLCPWLYKHYPNLISWCYTPGYGVGYIFISNLLATFLELLCMWRIISYGWHGFNKALVPKLLKYCYPLVLLGVAGNFNKMAGQILIPHLYQDRSFAMAQLGIYGGCLKIAVVMVMFMQAFRFAYDPFVFSKMKAKDNLNAYKVAMNYFLLFTCLIFLGVMYYIGLFKHIVAPAYYEGLPVVPVVMAGEILFGVYYNLSMWYKLSDRTYFGAIFSCIGLAVTVAVILIFTPRYGFIACAWASLVCNAVMMLLSYLFGRRYYPIPYNTGRLLAVAVTAALFYWGGMQIETPNLPLTLAIRTLLLLLFLLVGLRLLGNNTLQVITQILHHKRV